MGKIFLTIDAYLDGHGISRYFLSEKAKIRYDTINKYYRNRVIRYDSYVLAKICDTLHSDIPDIIRYEPVIVLDNMYDHIVTQQNLGVEMVVGIQAEANGAVGERAEHPPAYFPLMTFTC